jgi:hypothetical protein
MRFKVLGAVLSVVFLAQCVSTVSVPAVRASDGPLQQEPTDLQIESEVNADGIPVFIDWVSKGNGFANIENLNCERFFTQGGATVGNRSCRPAEFPVNGASIYQFKFYKMRHNGLLRFLLNRNTHSYGWGYRITARIRNNKEEEVERIARVGLLANVARIPFFRGERLLSYELVGYRISADSIEVASLPKLRVWTSK